MCNIWCDEYGETYSSNQSNYRDYTYEQGTRTAREVQKERFDSAIKRILSKGVISDRTIDIFEAAGIQKPELSILSEGFIAEEKYCVNMAIRLKRRKMRLKLF
ncbi:MAG TPA: type I restriction enzyme endonuclease domain-containing protein [Nitrososphaera sp.]|nr:type I restriction enzyme endonuclease domain-containing protein [Nitrososphaera sp.]